MKPNVFVSSTVEDLLYLRDAIRDTITEIGYNPILCNYGDVGYHPTESAEQSCYTTLKECQIAILIIGKRYSDLASNNKSVTHNEFRVAKEQGIPVICLIASEVLSFKKVYDSRTEDSMPSFPGMDKPENTFKFIQEFKEYKNNNGYGEFSKTNDAREYVKKQLASIFYRLLKEKFDPIKNDIKDVLSEIKTLKYELLKDEESRKDFKPFFNVIRYILDDDSAFLNMFFSINFGSIEDGVIGILKSESMDQLFKSKNLNIEIVDVKSFTTHNKEDLNTKTSIAMDMAIRPDLLKDSHNGEKLSFAIDKTDPSIIYLNKTTLKYLKVEFEILKRIAKK